MSVRLLKVLIIVFLAISVSGCATVGTAKNLQIQDLTEQIHTLNEEVKYNEQEINNLKEELSRMKQEKKTTVTTSKPSAKQIQIALKNAGYYKGTVDGKIGKVTRRAIRDFQRDNGLQVDGKVGRRTWGKLKNYL